MRKEMTKAHSEICGLPAVFSLRILIVCSVVSIAASLLVLVHSQGLLPFGWEKKGVTGFRHEIGHAYQIRLGQEWMSSHNGPSLAKLYENGILLGPKNSLHDDIRHLGKGRYSFWHDTVYFSSPDNSDPRINGRRYEICWPVPVPRFVLWGIHGFTLLCFLFTCVSLFIGGKIKVVKDFCNKHRMLTLLFSFFLVVLPLLVTRLPFFLYYRVASIQPDYPGYFAILHQIEQGRWPIFTLRTPGFPLFMKAVLMFNNKLIAVVLVQNALTLFSSLFMVYCVWRVCIFCAPLAAAAMAVFITSSGQTISDIALLSESLYSSTLVCFFAFIFLAVYFKRAIFFLFSSLFMALAIYTRPTAMSFIVVALFIFLFMLFNRYPRKSIFAFLIPLALFLTVLPAYNLLRSGRFTFTNTDGLTLLVSTSTYLEEDPAFGKDANDAIRKIQSRISEEDKKVIFHSWDLNSFDESYYRLRYWDCWNILFPFYSGIVFPEDSFASGKDGDVLLFSGRRNISFYQENRLYRAIALRALQSHPDIFLKAFILNLRKYFFDNLLVNEDFYGHLNYMYEILFLKKDFGNGFYSEGFRKEFLKEFYQPRPLKYFMLTESNSARFKPTRLQKLHAAYLKLHGALFRNVFWPLSTILLLAVSSLFMFSRKHAPQGPFILFVLCLSAIAHGVFCSVVSNVPRLSSPTLFIYYLSVALVPIMRLPGRCK